jgi:hypothetical protein
MAQTTRDASFGPVWSLPPIASVQCCGWLVVVDIVVVASKVVRNGWRHVKNS